MKSQKQDTTGISTLQTPTDQVTTPKEIAETFLNLSLQKRTWKASLKCQRPHIHL